MMASVAIRSHEVAGRAGDISRPPAAESDPPVYITPPQYMQMDTLGSRILVQQQRFIPSP